jgi:hypothetical protein
VDESEANTEEKAKQHEKAEEEGRGKKSHAVIVS